MMRELHTRPATEEEERLFHDAATNFFHVVDRDMDRYVFYAATTHDPESESPDWSDTRLMDLLDQSKKKSLFWLRSAIEKAIVRHATFDPSLPLDIIRRAHAGENDAMLAMARNYVGGEMGFPQSLGLSFYWLLRSAHTGSSMGRVLAASMVYHWGYSPIKAWIGAERARKSGGGPVAAIAVALQKQIELESAIERMEMGLPEFIRSLKANRPVTHQTLARLGFSDLQKKSFSNGCHYKDTGILLNDGNIIDKIELREAAGETLLIVNFGEHTITKENLEAEFGALRVFNAPKGRSVKEPITYINDSVDTFTVMVGVDQTTRGVTGFSVKSVLRKQP
jgi:hypothetical protein